MFILCNQHLHEIPTFKIKKTKNKITRWQNPLIFTWSVRLQFPWLTASKGNIYQNCKFLASHILKLFLQYLLQLVILDIQDIDTISILSHLVNKLEHQHNVYIMQQMTKPSNLHLIDRLQFPWLTASIVMLTNYSKILLKRLFQIFCLFCTIIQEKKDLNKGGSPSPVVMGVYSCWKSREFEFHYKMDIFLNNLL